MQLTVIIPCFNAAATLPDQLEALSKQVWSGSWELIISDNGSTDNSIEVAQRYEKKFENFTIIDSSKKRGGAYARNNGVVFSKSNNIAFCDADDEVMSGWVAAMGDALSQHNVVCGPFRFDKFNDADVAERVSKGWKDGLYIGNFLPGGGSGNCGIKKNIHQNIGGFDECLPWLNDADYFWKLQLQGHKLHVAHHAIIQVRIGRVNPSISSVYVKAKGKAAANYWLYKRYKSHGMKKPEPFKNILISWLVLLRKGVRILIRNNNEKQDWFHRLAIKTGFLVGEIQGRLTNPCN